MAEPSPNEGRGVGGTNQMLSVSSCARSPALEHLQGLAEQGEGPTACPSIPAVSSPLWSPHLLLQ